MAKIELAQLLEAGVHFGHKAHRWNPKMFPYIYTERDGVHILDLIQTAELLKQACDFAQAASEEGKTFLFVGTKRQAASVIAKEAQRCGAHYVNHRWLGGMLTNWLTLKTRIQRLKDLEEQQNQGLIETLPKKEARFCFESGLFIALLENVCQPVTLRPATIRPISAKILPLDQNFIFSPTKNNFNYLLNNILVNKKTT